ncbi:uncharacterized protein LOC122244305 [Penaeus japonicus]|uniref:uncharacterized protein LOC122244305 n=1 Tax=Penaeus japonicus TaxID=27405 RepID=UPI001C7169D0|nr:uncharacterized protein LOC122244305 [Penaeus japonicus]
MVECRVMGLLLLLLLLLGSNIYALLSPDTAYRGGQGGTDVEAVGRISPHPQRKALPQAVVRALQPFRDVFALPTVTFRPFVLEGEGQRPVLDRDLSGADSPEMRPAAPTSPKESLIFRNARRDRVPKAWFRRLRSCHTMPCSHSMDSTISLLMRMMEAGK